MCIPSSVYGKIIDMKLIVKHISKAYSKKKVLRDISFEAKDGQCIGFTGPNGCGKTTFLSILAGVEKEDSGTITLDGKPIGRSNFVRSKVGYLPQINPLPDNLKVCECLKLWCDDKATYDDLLKKYSLEDIEKKKISKLSGGMKRRVALCCVLATHPDILIMDEPTAALDIHYKRMIHKDMKAFTDKGGILIIVTHEREEMELCDICYAIVKGCNEEF